MASLAPPVAGREVPPARKDPDEPGWSRHTGIGLVGVLIAAFVAAGWWRFTAPFGDNHDGSNGGVWVDTARAILEHGPIASRLGSQLFTGGVYAHHPPLIAWVTAVGDWAGSGDLFADRLPVILGSLATIGLLVLLLRDVDLQWIAIAAGVSVSLGTPLFFVYGPMIDTLPLSLPIGVALLVLWRRRAEHGSAPGWMLGLTAAACVLSSWEAALLVGVTCLASMLLGRRDTAVLRRLAPTLIGAAIGLVVLGAWLLWASGSVGPLLHQLRMRSGTGHTDLGFGDSLRQQWAILGRVLGPVRWLLLPAAIVGLADRRTRLVMLVLVPTTVIYPLGLREAAIHDFWNLWFVAPLAIGVAAAVDRFAQHARTTPARAVLAIGTVLAVLASLAWTVADDPSPSRQFRLGLGAAAALDTAHLRGSRLYVLLPRGYNTNWIDLRTGIHARSLESPGAMTVAVLSHPRSPALLDCDQLRGSFRRACRKRSPDPRAELGGAYAVVPIGWISRHG
jgi:4-amino-4-deoxy-L-arabinose transferase-like glycosyltransferase